MATSYADTPRRSSNAGRATEAITCPGWSRHRAATRRRSSRWGWSWEPFRRGGSRSPKRSIELLADGEQTPHRITHSSAVSHGPQRLKRINKLCLFTLLFPQTVGEESTQENLQRPPPLKRCTETAPKTH